MGIACHALAPDPGAGILSAQDFALHAPLRHSIVNEVLCDVDSHKGNIHPEAWLRFIPI